MHSDSTAKEGDLAIVYRNEMQNMTADTQTQYITFPETVTLPEAFTGSSSIRLRAVDESVMFDGNVRLNQTSFSFDGWSENGMIRVEYQSENGITYNRTIFEGDSGDLTNPVDLGTTVHCEMSEEWNDMLGYFMQINEVNFGGLYKYDNYLTDDYRAYDMENYTYDPESEITLSIAELEQRINRTDIEEAVNAIESMLDTPATCISVVSVSKDYKKFIFCTAGNTETSFTPGDLYMINHKLYYGRHTSVTHYVRMFQYTIETKEAIELDLPTDTMSFYYNSTLNVTAYKLDAYPVGVYGYSTFLTTLSLRYYEDNTTAITVNRDCPSLVFYEKSYRIAPTQLTLSSPNQLLPGKIAYGKNGVVTGDSSIYSNLDKNEIYKNVYGLKTVFSDNSKSIYSLDDDLHISTCNDDTKIHKFKIDNTSTTDSIGLHNVILGYNELLKNIPEKYINNYRRVGNYNDVNNNKSYIIYQSKNTPTTIDLLSFDTYESEPVITNLPFELPWDDVITKFEWNDSYLIYNVYTNAYTPDTWYFGKVDLTNLTVQKITTFAQPSPYTNTMMIDFTLFENLVVFLCRTNNKANLENKYDLTVFNCSTNALHTLLSDLTTKYTQGFSEYGRYHIFNFENHTYITFMVEWNSKHHTIYKMYRLENDQVTTVVDDFGTYNWNEPTAYSNRDCSSFCIEDDDKVVDIKNGYIAYKTIANPGVKDTKLNDTSLGSYTWISNREYFLTENNKKIMYQVDEEPNITITEDNIAFNATKKLAIPLYFSSIAQNAAEDTTILFSSFKYKYTDKLVATNTSYLQIDTYTFIPGIFTDGNVYDYAVLNTVVSGTNTVDKANCIILAKTLGSNYTGTISPTQYITAVDTTEQILGRRKQ